MDIQLFASVLLVSVLVGFAGLVAFVAWLGHKERPEGTLENYRARFTPSVHKAEEIERALMLFEQEWLKRDPKVAKKLRKMLHKMNINWEDRRWRRLKIVDGRRKPRIVAAELTHNYTIKVWIGPKMAKKPRTVAYTGLVGALVQATLYNLYGEVAEDISDYKPLILAVNIKLLASLKEDKSDETS